MIIIICSYEENEASLGTHVLAIELNILCIRSAYHYLCSDEDQALHFATLYIQSVTLPLSLAPPQRAESLRQGLLCLTHTSLSLSLSLWLLSHCHTFHTHY